MADPDIRLEDHIRWWIQIFGFRGGKFCMFPTLISSLEGDKNVYSQTGWGLWSNLSPWNSHYDHHRLKRRNRRLPASSSLSLIAATAYWRGRWGVCLTRCSQS